MTNSSFLIVSLLVVFCLSSLDVGLASRRVLQSSAQSTADVQQTLTEIESLLKQIHSLLPKNAGAPTPYYNSAALQQTLAQLKSVIERNKALLPKEDTSPKPLSANSRRLFAESPEESEVSIMSISPSSGSNTPYYNMAPLASLPKYPHLPNGIMSGVLPRLPKVPGLFPPEFKSPSSNGDTSSPSASPAPSKSEKPQGFFAKLFHYV